MKTYQDMHIIGITIHMEKIRRFMYGFTIKEENIMVVINEEVKDETYEKLIEYYIKKCDTVMFVADKRGLSLSANKKLEKNMEMMGRKLKNSIIKKIHRPYWTFHSCMFDKNSHPRVKEEDFANLFTIYFYKTNNEVKEYLLSHKNLYTWLNPKYPEDISFFKNGWCLLSTIIHEKTIYIEVENQEEYEHLKNIGIEFNEPEFTPTPKEAMLFEEI